MDSEQNIREFVNNEDTKEIVNFLFDLPTAAFKFWGGLIKQSYKSKILEGSGVLEALKVPSSKELRKEAAILALLLKDNEKLTKSKDELTSQLSQERSDHIEKIKTFNEMTNQLSQERTDHAEILKTLENTKLKRKTENLTHEKIEARNEVKLVWKEKDEATKGSFYSGSTDEFVISSNM